jgi:hypothetical protein
MLPRNTGPSELAFKKEIVMLGHPMEELKLRQRARLAEK